MENFLLCPSWDNVEQTVATFVRQCPFYFDIVSITGKREKKHGFSCWYEVCYRMKDIFRHNWTFKAVEREIEGQKPLNTDEIDISFMEFHEDAQWIRQIWNCGYVVRCLDYQKCCHQGRFEFESEGFRPELRRIEDIHINLKWVVPEYYEDDFDDSDDNMEVEFFEEGSEDEGFYDHDDIFLML